ncbi:uncharacterized protein [Aristolochia californica]|uniref:uncharacterized protein n=1 Tax=Aristolochia californica TaxID=171875 RepID=UPI0035E1980A
MKFGNGAYNTMDNSVLRFDHVCIPRDQMLMRVLQATREGKCVQSNVPRQLIDETRSRIEILVPTCWQWGLCAEVTHAKFSSQLCGYGIGFCDGNSSAFLHLSHDNQGLLAELDKYGSNLPPKSDYPLPPKATAVTGDMLHSAKGEAMVDDHAWLLLLCKNTCEF